MQLFVWVVGLLWFSRCTAQLIFYKPRPEVFTPYIRNTYHQPSQYIQQPVLPEDYQVPRINFYPEYVKQEYLSKMQRTGPHSEHLTNFNSPSSHEPNSYKGFGYHTKYDDGATSTVVFFTGGVPGPNSVNSERKETITVASDSVDPQVPKGIEETINELFTNPAAVQGRSAQSSQFQKPISPLMSVIEEFIKNPYSKSQVFHFYALPEVTNSIESRSLDGDDRTLNNKTITFVETASTETASKDEERTTIKPEDLSRTSTSFEKNSETESVSTTTSGVTETGEMTTPSIIEKIDVAATKIETTTNDSFGTTVNNKIA